MNSIFGMGHGGPLGLLFTVLILLLGSYLIVRLYRAFFAKSGGDGDRNASLDIAKKRYARGDITADEYAQIRDVLAN